jgi:hypothetical protein
MVVAENVNTVVVVSYMLLGATLYTLQIFSAIDGIKSAS